MTTTAASGSPSGGPPTSSPGPPRRRRRRWRTVAIVGVTVFAVAAVGNFALQGGFAELFAAPEVRTTVACGDLQECIPSLRLGDVVGTLEAQGHTCGPDDTLAMPDRRSTTCVLEIGVTTFEARINSPRDGEGITDMALDFYRPHEAAGAFGPFPEDNEPPVVPYFTWFASLPYADDPDAVAKITAWITQQVKRSPEDLDAQVGGQPARVRVGDYVYSMHVSSPVSFLLSVTAERDVTP